MVAESVYAARDALDLIDVTYEPLPALPEPEGAADGGIGVVVGTHRANAPVHPDLLADRPVDERRRLLVEFGVRAHPVHLGGRGEDHARAGRRVAGLERRDAYPGRGGRLARFECIEGGLAAHAVFRLLPHQVGERLGHPGATVTRLGHGVPIGGELNYLDEGTLDAAMQARHR